MNGRVSIMTAAISYLTQGMAAYLLQHSPNSNHNQFAYSSTVCNITDSSRLSLSACPFPSCSFFLSLPPGSQPPALSETPHNTPAPPEAAPWYILPLSLHYGRQFVSPDSLSTLYKVYRRRTVQYMYSSPVFSFLFKVMQRTPHLLCQAKQDALSIIKLPIKKYFTPYRRLRLSNKDCKKKIGCELSFAYFIILWKNAFVNDSYGKYSIGSRDTPSLLNAK